jgi:hypothetical protein
MITDLAVAVSCRQSKLSTPASDTRQCFAAVADTYDMLLFSNLESGVLWVFDAPLNLHYFTWQLKLVLQYARCWATSTTQGSMSRRNWWVFRVVFVAVAGCVCTCMPAALCHLH